MSGGQDRTDAPRAVSQSAVNRREIICAWCGGDGDSCPVFAAILAGDQALALHLVREAALAGAGAWKITSAETTVAMVAGLGRAVERLHGFYGRPVVQKGAHRG